MKNNISGTICILGLDKTVYFPWRHWFKHKMIRTFLFLKNDNTAVVTCTCIFNISCLRDLVLMLIGIYTVKKAVKSFIVPNYFWSCRVLVNKIVYIKVREWEIATFKTSRT